MVFPVTHSWVITMRPKKALKKIKLPGEKCTLLLNYIFHLTA